MLEIFNTAYKDAINKLVNEYAPQGHVKNGTLKVREGEGKKLKQNK